MIEAIIIIAILFIFTGVPGVFFIESWPSGLGDKFWILGRDV